MVGEGGPTHPMSQKLGIGQAAEYHLGDGGRDFGGEARHLVPMSLDRRAGIARPSGKARGSA